MGSSNKGKALEMAAGVEVASHLPHTTSREMSRQSVDLTTLGTDEAEGKDSIGSVGSLSTIV